MKLFKHPFDAYPAAKEVPNANPKTLSLSNNKEAPIAETSPSFATAKGTPLKYLFIILKNIGATCSLTSIDGTSLNNAGD